MTNFDATRGFAGVAPGQDLAALLAKLTLKDLQLLIGERVLPLLPADMLRHKEALVAAAQRILQDRPLAVFDDPTLRKTLLRNLDPGKGEELRFRIAGAQDEPDLDQVDFDALTSPRSWPTALGFFGLEAAETAQAPATIPLYAIPPAFGLFEHQRSVVRRAIAVVGGGHNRTLVHMPTGSGKTRTAIHLIAQLLNENEPSVVTWLASSRELLEQAAETFEAAWSVLGNRPLDILRFWGNFDASPDELNDGLCIGGLAKLHAWKARDPAAFLRLSARTRLVVMDEAHQAIAPTYRAVIDGLANSGQYEAVLGLTATPGRTWNDVTADAELSDFFGGSKISLEVAGYSNPVAYLLDNGYLAKPTFRQLDYAPIEQPTTKQLQQLADLDDYSAEMLEAFAANTARNLAILSGVENLVETGHARIIVFAVSVRHAEDLAAALSVRNIESRVVSGETPLNHRAAILRSFKAQGDAPIVICNFGVLTTGFDAPKTSAAIIARPTKSLVLFSQMVGRATRGPRAGGNATCEILTVHDPAYPGFGDIAEAFFNWEDVWNEQQA